MIRLGTHPSLKYGVEDLELLIFCWRAGGEEVVLRLARSPSNKTRRKKRKAKKSRKKEKRSKKKEARRKKREARRKKREAKKSSGSGFLSTLGILFGLLVAILGGLFAWFRFGHKGALPTWIPKVLTKLLRPSSVVVPPTIPTIPTIPTFPTVIPSTVPTFPTVIPSTVPIVIPSTIPTV